MYVCNPQILIDKIMGSDYETNYDIYEKKVLINEYYRCPATSYEVLRDHYCEIKNFRGWFMHLLSSNTKCVLTNVEVEQC